MQNITLYMTTIVVWSLTWLAIHYQLGPVPAAWSVAYRFGLAGFILLTFCFITGRNLHYTWKSHLLLLSQGALLFSFNFLLFYWSSEYLISGVSAVIFATIVAMNIVNARIFFKTPLTLLSTLGALIGLLGLACVFWREIKMALLGESEIHDLLQGAIFCISATFVASLGNMLSKYMQTCQIPVLQGNGYAMIYGSLIMALLELLLGQPMKFDYSFSYIMALFYLTIFGSIIGFGCYIKLIGQIGPEKAAYVFVVVPVLALFVSSIAEDFHWGAGTLIGTAFILLGNCLILSRPVKRIVGSHS